MNWDAVLYEPQSTGVRVLRAGLGVQTEDERVGVAALLLLVKVGYLVRCENKAWVGPGFYPADPTRSWDDLDTLLELARATLRVINPTTCWSCGAAPEKLDHQFGALWCMECGGCTAYP